MTGVSLATVRLSDVQGPAPSFTVVVPACNPDDACGLLVSRGIGTLPSAPACLSSMPTAANSPPAKRSAGRRTSITDGALTQRSSASTFDPSGRWPKAAGSAPQLSPVGTSAD